MDNPTQSITQDVRSSVGEAEWDKRVNLAATYRLVHLYGMDEMIANHISTRAREGEDSFLINPYGLLYDQMHASCFIRIDLDGNILFNPGSYGINRAGFVITAPYTGRALRLTASFTPIRSPEWPSRP
jgi:Class II Aldolase and Adducin N-terminal domain